MCLAFHLICKNVSALQHIPIYVHDDFIQWKLFPRYWPFVRGIHGSQVNSPQKGQWRGALKFSLICTCLNGWVNKREAHPLWRHRNANRKIFLTRGQQCICVLWWNCTEQDKNLYSICPKTDTYNVVALTHVTTTALPALQGDYHLKSKLYNKDFLTRSLTGWQSHY